MQRAHRMKKTQHRIITDGCHLPQSLLSTVHLIIKKNDVLIDLYIYNECVFP